MIFLYHFPLQAQTYELEMSDVVCGNPSDGKLNSTISLGTNIHNIGRKLVGFSI